MRIINNYAYVLTICWLRFLFFCVEIATEKKIKEIGAILNKDLNLNTTTFHTICNYLKILCDEMNAQIPVFFTSIKLLSRRLFLDLIFRKCRFQQMRWSFYIFSSYHGFGFHFLTDKNLHFIHFNFSFKIWSTSFSSLWCYKANFDDKYFKFLALLPRSLTCFPTSLPAIHKLNNIKWNKANVCQWICRS